MISVRILPLAKTEAKQLKAAICADLGLKPSRVRVKALSGSQRNKLGLAFDDLSDLVGQKDKTQLRELQIKIGAYLASKGYDWGCNQSPDNRLASDSIWSCYNGGSGLTIARLAIETVG